MAASKNQTIDTISELIYVLVQEIAGVFSRFLNNDFLDAQSRKIMNETPRIDLAGVFNTVLKHRANRVFASF